MTEPNSTEATGGDPLFYFGRWCGLGWSAGRSGGAPLNAEERRSSAIILKGSDGIRRESPVDAACKLHDLRYESIAAERNPVVAAKMTLAADRELFTSVSRLIAEQAAGHNNLNLGEVLYAKDVRIAFGVKIITDVAEVADQLRRQAFTLANRNARAALRSATPYAILISSPTATIPLFVRLYRPEDLPNHRH
ncbi:hypothetical protein [Sphingomonas sp.]|uniref:hypothetical protein n=1 Tax=Sphingomonas sp. TaxID=28214 RepID=UPI003B3A55D7